MPIKADKNYLTGDSNNKDKMLSQGVYSCTRVGISPLTPLSFDPIVLYVDGSKVV